MLKHCRDTYLSYPAVHTNWPHTTEASESQKYLQSQIAVSILVLQRVPILKWGSQNWLFGCCFDFLSKVKFFNGWLFSYTMSWGLLLLWADSKRRPWRDINIGSASWRFVIQWDYSMGGCIHTRVALGIVVVCCCEQIQKDDLKENYHQLGDLRSAGWWLFSWTSVPTFIIKVVTVSIL